MSLRVLFAVSLFMIVCAQTFGDIEGSKAGEQKELVPGITFRWCPAGTFAKGEDNHKLSVTLTSGFWLGETEVTQGQWSKAMGTTPWSGKDYVKEGPAYPATYLSHDDAVSFCKKLTSQEHGAGRLQKGWKYSLPTEAQWEYACRAGTQTNYSFGDNVAQLGEYAWFHDNANKGEELYARQVGQKKPNAWGLRDMHGNVWEWCSDWIGEKSTGGRDPVGPSTGSNRVHRGGCWTGTPSGCRSALQNGDAPDKRDYDIGFRLSAIPE